MILSELLKERSAGNCELCKAATPLEMYEVEPQLGSYADSSIMLCAKCRAQIEKKEEPEASHWSVCLPETIWSEVPGVKIVTWRLLNRFRNESWAQDALDMMYLEDDQLACAKATGDHENDNVVELHRDSNGALLQNGDSVVLTKTLDVKGANMSAKVGTVVKNIKLVHDNVEQIEAKVDGQTIIILTKYLRRQG
ncbi:MAG: PhnA domain-containing protein [Chitinophagales bacterium]